MGTSGTTDKVDQRLAADGLAKLRAGKKPSHREASAIKRIEKAREESDRWRFYKSVPKKHYGAMSGRPPQTVNSQAAVYGIPCGGPVVDVGAVIRWLHDFLADHKDLLAVVRSHEQGPVNDPGKRADVAYKRERMRMLRLRRQEREGDLLSRADIHEGLAASAAILRRAGARLRKEFGDDAYRIMDEGIDDALRKVEQLFGDSNGDADG